jgi:16S rRNA C967 or C1407 C5-methylase (RsmB/RsmF family)
MNEDSRLTVRANTLKTNRDELIKDFTENYGWKCYKTEFAPNGIRFIRPPDGNLFRSVEYKKGHFEVQDEAS